MLLSTSRRYAQRSLRNRLLHAAAVCLCVFAPAVVVIGELGGSASASLSAKIDTDADGIPNQVDNDIDGDGILNSVDPEVDGDGIANGPDLDVDGDTLLNGDKKELDVDSDGIADNLDPDIDGDGLMNGADADVDGDGVPNAVDPDVDGDAIKNAKDPDIDGDGLVNGIDPDIDGDGILNGVDTDTDGDGKANDAKSEKDTDGDGIKNTEDPDVDGDGVLNGDDPDVDGDGINNATDPDIDGDGRLNGARSEKDIDGDGVLDAVDPDVDADGIANGADDDIDGDGIANATDDDQDGDGVSNKRDSDSNGDGTDDSSETTPPATTRSALAAPQAASTIIRTITAKVQPCSVGTGLAFDGAHLLVSCWYSNTVEAVSPADGSLVTTYHVAGVSGIGAISWDAATNQLWGCDTANNNIITIDLRSGNSTPRFATAGCIDGVSYDPTDNTLWVSGDASPTLLHYNTNGTVLSATQLGSSLGGCGNSGIAVGGSQLFLANNGCSQIYQQPKASPGDPLTSVLIGTYPARLEDLECDDQTFAGTTVIWSKDAYDAVLNAFDVGAVDCGVKGYRDSDDDGLSDQLETTDADLIAMGASPTHKDLFVEVDHLRIPYRVGPWAVGANEFPLSQTAADKMVAAFAAMPTTKYDKVGGITLHLDNGPTSVMDPKSGAKWGSRSASNAVEGVSPTTWSRDTFWLEYDKIKNANMSAARRQYFHYVYAVDQFNDDGNSGISRTIPGRDVVLSSKYLTSPDQQAVVLTHELGHNLGLGHGGRERSDDPKSQDTNFKADYLSIMNYFYSIRGLTEITASGDKSGRVAFSSEELSLNSTNLSESSGLNPKPAGHYRVTYRCPGTTWVGAARNRTADSAGSIDWNCDGRITDPVQNENLQPSQNSTSYQPKEVRTLLDPAIVRGSNDYPGLLFEGVGSAWDNYNSAVEALPADLDEPTVADALSDGVFWPEVAIDAPQLTTVTMPRGIGLVSVPVSLRNPNQAELSVTASVATSSQAGVVSVGAGGVVVPGLGSVDVLAVVDTSLLIAGSTIDVTLQVLAPDGSVLSEPALEIQVPTESTTVSDLCSSVAAALADPGLTAAQQTVLLATNARLCGINHAPSVDISGAIGIDEGATYGLVLGTVTGPGANTVSGYVVHWGDGTSDSYTTAGAKPHAYLDGPLTADLTVDLVDEDGTFLNRANPLTVTVANVPPVAGLVKVSASLVAVNTAISATAPFTDRGSRDTHTAVWDWGDLTTSPGSITEAGGSGTATATHLFTVPGVYPILVTIRDNDGGVSDQAVYLYVVVYDPSAGFVTGSGKFNSPVGALPARPTATGRAEFGFSAGYNKSGRLVSESEFELKFGDFEFHSDNAQWLVIRGATGQLQGTGTVEGSTHQFGYLITVTDGQVPQGGGIDRIRLQVWDDDNSGAVVYDNEPASPRYAAAATPIAKGQVKLKAPRMRPSPRKRIPHKFS